MSGKDPLRDDGLVTEKRAKTKTPRLYKVILHNDDFTTMEFVIYVLMKHFDKDQTAATQLMLQVHTRGQGIAGVYSYEVAETKQHEATDEAREHGMPLMVTMEPE